MIQIKDYFLLIVFVPAILWFGFWASLLDIKAGKVRNSLIRSGYVFGIVANTLLFASSVWLIYMFPTTGSQYLSLEYFLELLINVAISFVVGFAFWKYDFWAAADSKMFTLFAFLIPLTVYQNGRMPYFPSFTFLLNVYVVYLLYILVFSLVKSGFGYMKIRKIAAFLKSRFKKANLRALVTYLAIYYITFIAGFSLRLIQIGRSDYVPILFYVGAFVVLNPLRNFLKKIKMILFLLLAAETGYTLYLIFFPRNFSLDIMFKQMGVFAFYMALMALLIRILSLSNRSERKMVRTKDVSANMVLTQSSFARIKDKDAFAERLGKIYPDGLLENQIITVRELLEKEKVTEIEIFKTFPFIPFIFAGALSTIIIKGSILDWLAKVMHLIHL